MALCILFWKLVCRYVSLFPLLTKVEFHAATVLKAPADMMVQVWIWSYAAVDAWVNRIYQGGIDTPVYKPINREVLELPLKQGENLVYVRLPDSQGAELYTEADLWLLGTVSKSNTVKFPEKAPEGSSGIRKPSGRQL